MCLTLCQCKIDGLLRKVRKFVVGQGARSLRSRAIDKRIEDVYGMGGYRV